MRTVGIVGENAEKLLLEFSRLSYGNIKLPDGSYAASFDIEILDANASASFGTTSNDSQVFDVLIAQDAKPCLPHALEALSNGAFLVLNSDKKEILPFLSKKRKSFHLITYGFNSKACVTASSTMDGVIQACVQRGFTTLDGRMLQPGEFDFPFGGELSEIDADAVLGFAAACLACGVI